MNAISTSLYGELLSRLNKMEIRGNMHKMSVFAHLDPDQQRPNANGLTNVNADNTVFAFNIMFERNNPDSEWRLVTPLKFVD